MTVERFCAELRRFFLTYFPQASPYGIGPADDTEIRALVRQKYGTWEWNYGESPPYTFRNVKKLSFGIVDLRMEVVECKPKPSYPVGELTVDAFGKTREYTDRGIRRRALCAAGRVDYGDPFDLTPRLAGVEVLGASSDHTILDVEDAAVPVRLGDVLDFGVSYGSLVYLTNTPEVRIVYRKGGRLYTAE